MHNNVVTLELLLFGYCSLDNIVIHCVALMERRKKKKKTDFIDPEEKFLDTTVTALKKKKEHKNIL